MHLVKTGRPTTIAATIIAKTILGAVLVTGVSTAATAQNMVVRSTGPSASAYPAGKKLANTAKITLKNMDQVTVLGKSGTRVLKGPGTFSLSAKSRSKSSTSTRLASFINNRGSTRARTGAVRGSGVATVTAPTNPNLWFLDIGKGGKFCVANPTGLVVWRPDYTGSATASIVAPDTGGVTEVSWTKGNPLKAWPSAQAPIKTGARYQLIGSNVEKAVEVDFVMLDKAPADLDEAATALIANGCQGQLDLLVETLDIGSDSS